MVSGYRAFLKCVLYVVVVGSLIVIAGQLFVADYFLSPERLTFFLILPTIIGISGAILLFVRPQIQLLGLLCAIGALVAIFGAELYLELRSRAMKWSHWTPWQANEEVSYPPMCGKYVDAVRQDSSIYSVLNWQGQELQPVGGISSNHLGEGAYSDRHGFLNPPGEWELDRFEILAIGDSFAAGADVPRGKGFVDLIRGEVGPTINLGCSWNGPLFELASLIEYGPRVRSKFVIWFYYEGNDLVDLELESRSPLLINYLDDGFEQGLPKKQEIIDTLLKDYVDARLNRSEKLSEKDTVPLSYVVYGDPSQKSEINWRRILILQNLRVRIVRNYGQYRSTFDLLGRILAHANQEVERWHGRLIFVYLPGVNRFRSKFENIQADSYRQEVLDVVEGLDIPVIDLTPVFRSQKAPMDLFDAHYSIEGNALVARTIVAALENHAE